MSVTSHPPKPRFGLSVGVVGHRPDRLPENKRAGIARDIALALEAIRAEAISAHARYTNFFVRATPKLTLVTALAEGADRVAAEAALANGFELEMPLPFAADEYEKDFESPAGKSAFHRLLARASGVLELDGNRAQAGRSYADAGLVVLDNADILIAVWDGGAAHGRGGTTEMIHEAAKRGMPIVRIDVEGENQPILQWRGLGNRHTLPAHLDDHPAAALDSVLAAIVDELVRPPNDPSERDGLDRYLEERARRFTARIEFPLLMVLLGVRWPRIGDVLLPEPGPPAHERARGRVITAAFEWADAIAVRFARDFRSAVVMNFLVSAIAVVVAFSLPYPWTAIELVLVFLLVLNALVGHARRWHHRWIESREVAERLRVAEAMRALGTRAAGPSGAVPTWPAWYARAIVREAGLRSGKLDSDGRQAARMASETLIADQAAYHESTARQFRTLHGRLTTAGQFCFLAALFLSAAILIVKWWFGPNVVTPEVNRWMIIAAASLPALGSASYGIRMLGDFEGSAKRSARMKAQLDLLQSTIGTAGLDYEWLRDRVHKTNDVMLGDVASWRLVVESRELSMPG
jgi:hypothetical protein